MICIVIGRVSLLVNVRRIQVAVSTIYRNGRRRIQRVVSFYLYVHFLVLKIKILIILNRFISRVGNFRFPFTREVKNYQPSYAYVLKTNKEKFVSIKIF